MICLELFSGNAPFSKEMERRGHKTLTVDYDPKCKADICEDIMKLHMSDLFFKVRGQGSFDSEFHPFVVWASPECKTYSLASRGKHRKKSGEPKTVEAFYDDAVNRHLWKDMLPQLRFLPFGYRGYFIIENPVGYYRKKVPFSPISREKFDRVTVYYGNYGFPYPKPTDIFTNVPGLAMHLAQTKPMTKMCDGVSEKGDYLGRCSMPDLLIKDIVDYLEKVFPKP